MTDPWIEVGEYQDSDYPTSPRNPENAWQASFACQVEVPSFLEWSRLKWGFNNQALFEEAQDRQRLFLESQYAFPDEFGMEPKDQRTLAYRFICRPREKLLSTVIGKIHARTDNEVQERALSYYRAIKATFPYDYELIPAPTQKEFDWLCGKEIFESCHHPPAVALIRRMEFPVYSKGESPCLQGFWRSGAHAHDQVWRALAISPAPIVLNISLRSTVIFDDEREGYITGVNESSGHPKQPLNQLTAASLKLWLQETAERRLAPWKKFFYLQVQLISPQKLSNDLLRTIGTSLTMHGKGNSLPGYTVTQPYEAESQTWRRKIQDLDIILPGSFLSSPRLSEVADLEEVFDVMQLPCSPPENGFPDLEFYSTKHR
jgi:hypothetical protein